ncbi:MAG: amino acid transporter permease [Frondihabitans sp.]|nr:amino acid transporter permease [Frondihabitans sp.]
MSFLTVFSFWPLLLSGFLTTLLLSAVAIVGGGIVGAVVGVAVTDAPRWVRWILTLYIGLFRGTPLLIQLFLIYLGLPYVGINLDVFAAAAIGFTLYGGAYVAEIVRSGLEAVPAGQREAAASNGLTYLQTLRHVVAPQSLRTATAPLLSFFLSVIKDTSIASIIGYVDIIQQGQAVIAITNQPFQAYVVVAAAYFAVCFPISLIVGRFEKRLARA